MKKGLVTMSRGLWYTVEAEDGSRVECRLPGRFRLNKEEVTNPVAVGDRVDLRLLEDGTGVIETIHERKNVLMRQAAGDRRGDQILAANLDCAWVVQALRRPRLKTGFIDRFLVTCEAYHIPAGIIINKIDLGRERDLRMLDDLEELYTGLGYRFLRTSIHQPDTIESLREEVTSGISVFSGHSGTGKTSLLNALVPGLTLRTAEVSDASEKGRHTTTFATMISLPGGGYVVDTPGIRELGLAGIEPEELSLYFPEMAEARTGCRYYNCTHSHEPDCAVLQACEEGDIHPDRYLSYLQILESLEEEE